MKKMKYILGVVLLSFCFSSCQDWLDVQPKTEIKQDKLFESESGFKDALMGAYILMGDRDLYGRELSLGLLEVLSMQYVINAQSSSYGNITTTNYVNLNSMTKIWSKQYTIIANVNAILNEIDAKKGIMKPTSYALIKGEALALRASLHFDLMRMYGWGDIANRPEVLNRPMVPYVTKYDKEMTEQTTLGEGLKLAEQDLLEAKELLYSYDNLSNSTRPDDYEYNSNDLFTKNRKSRFNYWAVTATLARLHMWKGEYSNALPYCEEIMTSKSFAWIDANRYIHTSDPKEIDFKLLPENIFTLTSNKLYEKIKPLVESYSTSTPGSFTSVANNDFFSFKPDEISAKYEVGTNVGTSDWRYTKFFKFGGEAITYSKYYEYATSTNANKVPLITVAEFYYYAAECYYRMGDNEKAVGYLNSVRVNRGIEYDKNLPVTLPSERVFEEIVKEWKKEFIGIAGNMFYFYKRLNLLIPGSSRAGDEAFVFPIPMAEIEMGRLDNVNRK